MFVLNAPPDAFNLPARPRLPRLNIVPSAAATLVAAAGYCRRRFRLPAPRLTRTEPPRSTSSNPPPIEGGYYDLPVIHGPHWKWLVIGVSTAGVSPERQPWSPHSRDCLAAQRPRRWPGPLRTSRSWRCCHAGFCSSRSAGQLGSSICCARSGSPPPCRSAPGDYDVRSHLDADDRCPTPGLSIGTPRGMTRSRSGATGKGLAFLGGLSGFFVAGYTGVVPAATARPLWRKRPALLGPLFLSSAMTSGAAAISAVASAMDHEESSAHTDSAHWRRHRRLRRNHCW